MGFANPRFFLLASILLGVALETPAWAHGGDAEGGSGTSLELESFTGNGGYRHTGVGFRHQLDETWAFGFGTHAVREANGEKWFPSFGAQLAWQGGEGLGVEGFTFHYVEQDGQNALAGGVRIERALAEFELWGEDTDFVGRVSPVYANAHAIDEASGRSLSIGHALGLLELEVDRGAFGWALFGTGSTFSRSPKELESRVDLGEMTQRGVYENNDGFARWSAGTELSYEVTERIGVGAAYAAIAFPGVHTRHSIWTGVELQLNDRMAISVGLQQLTGGEASNTLGATGLSFNF